MPVTSLSAIDPSTQAPGTVKTNRSELGQDGFLKLLVAQLQNQDPTGQGQDPDKMVQQLTSFSSLEQVTQTNSLLRTIQDQNTGLAQVQAAALVGRTVKVAGSGFSLQGGKASMALSLAGEANVMLTVKDGSGKVVATLDRGRLAKGLHTVEWDGLDGEGKRLPDGAYSVTVTAKDPGTGAAVEYATAFLMKVDSVSFANGQILLQSGNSAFQFSDVLQIIA